MLLALRSLWQAKVVITALTVNLQVVPTPAGTAAIEIGTHAPEVITAIVPVTLRPTTAIAFGDEDLLTGGYVFIDPAGVSGTAEVKATGGVSDAPVGSIGAISHVIFHAVGWRMDSDTYSYAVYSNPRMGWRVNGVDGSAAVVNSDPATIGSPSYPILRFGSPPFDNAGDPVPTGVYLETAPVLFQPNGNPWTWAAVNDLEDIALRYDWTRANFGVDGDHPGYVDLAAREMWAEVFGVGGGITPRKSIRFRMTVGAKRTSASLGVDRAKQFAGNARTKVSL